MSRFKEADLNALKMVVECGWPDAIDLVAETMASHIKAAARIGVSASCGASRIVEALELLASARDQVQLVLEEAIAENKKHVTAAPKTRVRKG